MLCVCIGAGLKTQTASYAGRTSGEHNRHTFHSRLSCRRQFNGTEKEREREAVALRSNGHNTNVTVQIATETYSRSETMHLFQIMFFQANDSYCDINIFLNPLMHLSIHLTVSHSHTSCNVS